MELLPVLIVVAFAFALYPGEVEGGSTVKATVVLGLAAGVPYLLALGSPWYRHQYAEERRGPWITEGAVGGWTIWASLLIGLAIWSLVAAGLRQRPAPVRAGVLLAGLGVGVAWIGYLVDASSSRSNGEVERGLNFITSSFGLVMAAFVVLGVARLLDRRRLRGGDPVLPVHD